MPPTSPSPTPRPASPSFSLVGLALLGWGLAILAGFVPHEDLLVGAGLLALGACITAATGFPQVPWLPRWPFVCVGAILALGVPAYVLLAETSWDPPKAVLWGAGLLVLALLPLHHRTLPLPGRLRGTGASLSTSAVAVVGGPGVVYVLQSLFVKGTGVTPIEAFLRVGLLAPLAAVAGWLGWHPDLAGQVLTFDGPAGPMGVDVGAACSGIQAMALFGVLLGVQMLVQRPPPGKAALWAAIGLGGVYVANLLRLVTIVAVGHWWGPDALAQAHADAGWMFFVAWALLYAWLARRSMRPARPPPLRPGGATGAAK